MVVAGDAIDIANASFVVALMQYAPALSQHVQYALFPFRDIHSGYLELSPNTKKPGASMRFGFSVWDHLIAKKAIDEFTHSRT